MNVTYGAKLGNPNEKLTHSPLIPAAEVAAELPVVPLRVQVGEVLRGAAPPPRPPLASRPAARLARLPGPRRRRRHRPVGLEGTE